MGETSKRVDGWFESIQKYVTGKIGSFVAFLFLLYSAGALTALFVMTRYPNHAYLVVIIPALAGAIAYYNRAFATGAFFILILGLLFF
jgi:hypothetical protein